MFQDNSTLPTNASNVSGVDTLRPISIQAEKSAAAAKHWGRNDVKGDELLKQALGETLILFRQALEDADGFEQLLKDRKIRVTNRAGNRIAVGVIRLAFSGVTAPAHARVKSNQSTWASCIQGLHRQLPDAATVAEATDYMSVKGCGVKETARAFRRTRRAVAHEEPRWSPARSEDAQIEEFLAGGADLPDLRENLGLSKEDHRLRLGALCGDRFRVLDLSEPSILKSWSFSMKLGRPRKWPAFMAARSAGPAVGHPFPMGIGKRRPSPAPCASTA